MIGTWVVWEEQNEPMTIDMLYCQRCGSFCAGPPVDSVLIDERGAYTCWPCWQKPTRYQAKLDVRTRAHACVQVVTS